VEWRRIGLVAGVAITASMFGLGNQFAWDDGPLLVLDTRLHGLGRWREILTSPFWPAPWSQEHYRPVTSLLLAFQHGLGDGAPVVFRITSYLLYAAVCVALFMLARRLLPAALALAVALLFAAHPVHVEAVAPAVSQSELLVALFAALMVLRYVDRRRSGDGRLTGGDWAFLGTLYVAASLSKEHGMAIPALLAAAEAFLAPAAPWRARLRQLRGGYALLAGLGLGLVALRLALLEGQFSGQWTAEALDGLSPGMRVLTVLAIVPQWVRLFVWPRHLRADYAPQEFVGSTGLGPTEALGLALVLGAVALLWLTRRRAPVVAFGIAWMAVTLLPVSNVIMPAGHLIAERVLFLPSAGFLLAVGGGAAALASRVVVSPAAARLLWAGCIVLVGLGIARSAERHRVWRHEALYAVRGVQDSPRSYRMQRAYGDILFQLGEFNLAVEAYQRALTLVPPEAAWRVRNDLARRYREQGETRLEVDELRASLAQVPDQEDARGHLVVALLALGRYEEAKLEVDTALARGVSRPEVFRELRALADSAARVMAPAGSVRVRIRTG
jgi:hypothetical protein